MGTRSKAYPNWVYDVAVFALIAVVGIAVLYR